MQLFDAPLRMLKKCFTGLALSPLPLCHSLRHADVVYSTHIQLFPLAAKSRRVSRCGGSWKSLWQRDVISCRPHIQRVVCFLKIRMSLENKLRGYFWSLFETCGKGRWQTTGYRPCATSVCVHTLLSSHTSSKHFSPFKQFPAMFCFVLHVGSVWRCFTEWQGGVFNFCGEPLV